MGDFGDYWRDVKQTLRADSQQRRADNRAHGAEQLAAAGIGFESRNDGASALGKTFDYWPGTGLWCERGSAKSQRGIRSLLRAASAQGEKE